MDQPYVTDQQTQRETLPLIEASRDSLVRVTTKFVHTYIDTIRVVRYSEDSVPRIDTMVTYADSTSRKGHYVQAYIGGGYGSIGFRLNEDHGGKVSGSFSGRAQLQYAYFFHEHWGVGAGLWLENLSSVASLANGKEYTDFFYEDRTDTDGNQYVKKGYRHYDLALSDGAVIDVFVLHMDAGDNDDAINDKHHPVALAAALVVAGKALSGILFIILFCHYTSLFVFADLDTLGICPQFLKLIESPFLRLEDMHHHIEVVHQYPLGIGVAFHFRRVEPRGFFHHLVHMVAQGAHMRGHIARRYHEERCRGTLQFAHIQYLDVYTFLFAQCLGSQFGQNFRFSHLLLLQ